MAEDQTQLIPSLKVKCEKSNEAGDRSISESFYVEVNEDFKNEPQEFTAKENVSVVQSSLETLKNESISEENTVKPETHQVRDIFDTEHNNNESVANISSPNMTKLNTKEIMSVNENQQMEHEISDNNIQKTNNKQNFMCDLCGCVCSTKTNLIKHKTSHFLPKPFKCEYCPKAFSQSVYLIKHMTSHSTSMRLDCHICGKTVASKDSLEKHLTLHSDYKPYSCSQCDKSFSQKDSYKKHIEMHKKEKEIKFQCNSCNLVLKTKHALTEHLKIHSGEKPFHCKECGRYFKGLTILKMHMKLHYNPKKCDICGKLFASKDQLVKHTRIHTGERPYKCNKCGKGFAQTSGHKRHQNNCTIIKAKSVSIKDLVQSNCRRCGRSFKQKANLPRPAVICNICLQESIVEYEHIKNHLERTLPSNIPEEGSIKRAKISIENPKMFNTNIVQSESHEQKQLLKFISNESDTQRPKKAIPENTEVGCGNNSDVDSFGIIKSYDNPLDNDVESEIHKVINISETECTNSKSISSISNSKFDIDNKVVEREEEEMESEKGNSKYNGETEFIENKKKGFVCDQCGRVCSLKTNLEKHIASHSVNMRLSCHNCGKMLKTKDSLEKHLTLHSNHKPFSCPQCDKSFSQKDSLNKHLEIHQREKQAEFQCNSCSLVLKSKFDLTEHMKTHSGEIHMRIHTGERPYKCNKCGQGFTQQSSHKRHQESCVVIKPQSVMVKDVAQSSCRRCGRSFKHKANLDKPIEICNICLQESIAECGPVEDNLEPSIGRPNKNNNTEQCESEGPSLMLSTGLDEATSKDTYTVNLKDSSISTSDAVQSALENYIVVESSYTGEKMYKCRHCSKLYSSKSDFIGHLLSHQCGLLWKCNICGKSVKNSDSLSRHMQLHSGLKPFACHLCDRSFKQKGTLVKHIEMHNKGEKFECNLCSERFKTDHALKQHTMVHTGEKPFGCATCGKHFRLQVSLRQHEKVHTSPHVCHFCDKEFSAFNLLEKHVRIHTGERPYKCIKCEKGFNQRSGLKRHLRSCKAARLSIGNIPTIQKKVEVQRTESTSQGYEVSYNNEINDHVDKSDSVSTDCIEKLSEHNIYLSNNTETSQQSETTSVLMENTCKSQTNIKNPNLNLTLNISCETVADEMFNENQDEKVCKDPSVGTEDECEMSKDIDITQETSDDDIDEFIEDDHTDNADEFIEEDCKNEDQNGIEKDILKSSKSNLNSHVNETFWKCNLCGKNLKSKETLENHMTLHTDIKPYACNICDKAFSQKGSLVKHVEIHQKERNYECTFCKELFNTSFALSEHVKIHTGEKSFACRFCAKYFSTRMSLRDHEKRHTNPLTCNECGKIFGTNDQMRNHLRTHSGERPFKCNKCGKGFAQRSGQRRHLKSCNSKANASKDVEMKNANDDFNSHDQSLTEYLTSHQNMDAFSNILSEKAKQENNFSKTTNSSDASDIEDADRLNDVNNEVQLNVSGDSKECMNEENFPKLYSLLQQSDSHVLRSESGTSSSEVKNSVTGLTLENCLSRTSTNEIVSSDKEEHVLRPENVHSDKEEYVEDVHSDKEEYVEDVQSDKEEYVLRPEDVQSDNEDYILRPEDVINIDNVNIPLELPVLEKETIVDYNWDRPSIYKDYIQVIDGVKKYVCNVCHKSFNHSTGLRQHLTLHTGEKPFICEFCGKCFNLNSALKVHTRTHLNTKPYTCEICNKDFACDKSIKNHKLMHAGEIKYSCDICGKGFILLHAYKKHIQSHSGEKSHQCHTCGKSFAHESSYKSHMQMHSGISPYWCKNCGNQYSCSSSLYKHRKKCTKLRVEMG